MSQNRASVPKVQLTSSLNPQWYFRFRIKGRKNADRVLIGPGSLSKRQAEKGRDAKIVELRALPDGYDRDLTFAGFIETVYVPEHLDPTKKKSTTINLYQKVITDHILPHFGPMRLTAIKLIHVNAFLKHLYQLGHAYNTIDMERSILKSIFTRAEQHEMIDKNPTRFSEIPGGTDAKLEKRVFTPAHVTAIMNAHAGIRLLVGLGISTGMRISELLALRWENVNLVDGWLVIKERLYKGTLDRPKNKAAMDKEHAVGSLLQEMRERRAAQPDTVFVFQRPDSISEPWTYAMANKQLRCVLNKLGIWTEGCSFHALRRAYITYMLPHATGLEVADMVGKASAESLKEYVQVPRERRESLTQKVQEQFLGRVQ